jgi:hypothetical protein
MKKSLFKIFLFLLVCSPLQLLSQEVFKDESAGVQLTIPANWYYENEDNSIMFYPKDKDIIVTISTHEASSVDKLVEALINDLSKSLTDVNLSSPADDEINGLKGWEIHGTAKNKDGVEMTIDYGLYVTPKDKVLELGVVTTGDIMAKYKDDIETLIKGIKPIE